MTNKLECKFIKKFASKISGRIVGVSEGNTSHTRGACTTKVQQAYFHENF